MCGQVGPHRFPCSVEIHAALRQSGPRALLIAGSRGMSDFSEILGQAISFVGFMAALCGLFLMIARIAT
jgi:hypothetical protein